MMLSNTFQQNRPQKNNTSIGIDLDDVLLNFNDAFLSFHNERFGTIHARSKIRSFKLEELLGCSLEQALDRLHDFYISSKHDAAIPVEGAVEAITHLAKKHRLFIITAKPKMLKEKTHAWLRTYFPDVFEDIHFTRENRIHDVAIKKSEVCKKLGIDIFIDDSIQNARDISSAGIPVLLLDTPWNQGDLPDRVTRVFSWKEILEHIE